MLLCLNRVLSKWVTWHSTFLGRLQNRKIEEMWVEGIFWKSFISLQYGKKGKMTFWKLGIENIKTLMVEENPDLHFSLSPAHPPKVKRKNIVVLAQKQRWLTTGNLFWRCSYLLQLHLSCTTWWACPFEMKTELWQTWVLPSLTELQQSWSNWEHLWKLLCVDKVFSWQRNYHLSLRSREEQNFITCK